MIGHVIGGIGLLILAFLVLSNWTAATALLTSGSNAATGYTKVLQGRG